MAARHTTFSARRQKNQQNPYGNGRALSHHMQHFYHTVARTTGMTCILLFPSLGCGARPHRSKREKPPSAPSKKKKAVTLQHEVLKMLKGLMTNVHGNLWWTMIWQKNARGTFWTETQAFNGPRCGSQCEAYFNRAGREC